MKEKFRIDKIEELSKTIFAKTAGKIKLIAHFNHGRYFIELENIELTNTQASDTVESTK